jgi:excisionase family DNA binding protein
MNKNVFYTAPEIATLFKTSRALVYRLISQGHIPSVRVGKAVRVTSDSLDKFIQDNMSGQSFSARVPDRSIENQSKKNLKEIS